MSKAYWFPVAVCKMNMAYVLAIFLNACCRINLFYVHVKKISQQYYVPEFVGFDECRGIIQSVPQSLVTQVYISYNLFLYFAKLFNLFICLIIERYLPAGRSFHQGTVRHVLEPHFLLKEAH